MHDVSVSGEFQRVASETATFLRSSQAGGAASLAGALVEAARLGRSDLSAGASDVVELLEGPTGAPRFGSDQQGQEFRRTALHLRGICRAILGR